MKIKDIRAFTITRPGIGQPVVVSEEGRALQRRAPWIEDAEVASPMARFPRYKARRASWRATWPAVGCVVITDDGTWGFGTTSLGDPVVAVINQHLGPLLVDENPMAIDKLYDLMLRLASPYSPAGLASYAISAIDLALWDLKGRALGLPVFELAGGPARERQTCYATGNDTDWHLELGFTATKLACPYGPADDLAAIDRNEALVAETRELIGPDVDLMLDCWMAFDVAFAVRLAERLRPYGLRWIEDCLIPENPSAHDALRQRLAWQTLATGEHWYTPYAFFDAARRQVVDIFQPDIHWVGGFTACQRIAAIAETAGLEVILHAGMNTPYGQHFGYASSASHWGEFFVGGGPGVPLDKTIGFPGMRVPQDGSLTVSDAPGFGHGLSLETIETLSG
ncbi:enolase C-terminal domain-like protein [Bauldia sp.]|uniref:enolase C-terminal domain-like protein n=1 Tax=Bauldia sp. TaxID=2575872 RepID=UPI003BA9E78F